MNKKISALIGFAFFSLTSLSANAAIIGLYDWGVNIDGTVSEIGLLGDPIPGSVDVSGFNQTSGLGRIDIFFSGAGAHNALTFVDHEIDEAINTFFNENGTSSGGALGAGQTAEIDEPGFVFGDIYTNFLNNSLDNTNSLLPGNEDDVSMAIGWDFTLGADEVAVASFFTSLTNDSGGLFTLEQNDPDSSPVGAQGGTSIFFWSDLDIGPAGLPEPGTLGLALFGMLSAFGLRRRKLQ